MKQRHRSGRASQWAWCVFALGLCLACVPGAGAGDPAPPSSFCWRVTSPTSVAYLLGSLHFADESIYPLPLSVEQAFQDSAVLVVEANPSKLSPDEITALVMAKAVEPAGIRYEERLDDQAFEALMRVLDRHGLAIEEMRRLKPWYLAQVVTVMEMQRLGLDPKRGIDRHFLDRSNDDKTVVELEGLAHQLDFLSRMSEDEQQSLLLYTLRDIANLEATMGEMIDAWKAGDASDLDELLTGYVKASPELQPMFRRLFAERNLEMLKKILAYLAEPQSYFIVVGAGHLVGEEGLLALLADAGMTLKQLPGAEPVAAEQGKVPEM